MLAVKHDERLHYETVAALVTLSARNKPNREANEHRRKWYLLCIDQKSESIVNAHLLAHQIQSYAPRELADRPVWSRNVLTGVRYISGRKQVVKPMFVGYMFARLDYETDWPKVRSRPGVLRIAKSVEGNPLEVPEWLIVEIQQKEQIARDPRAKAAKHKVGEKVRVNQGAFNDFIAEIQSLDDDGRIRALIDLLGRKVPLLLTDVQIEAI